MNPLFILAILLASGAVACADDDGVVGGRGETLAKVYADFPAWSPDGESILFYRVPTGTLPGRSIWETTVDGDSCWFVTDGNTPAWSPDGEKIAFGRNREIWIRDVATGNERALTPSMNAFFPAWEPSGNRIVFDVSTPPELAGLWLIASEGGKPQRINIDGIFPRMPCWSPDGKWIAFRASDGNSIYNVYRLNLSSGLLEQLTANNDRDWRPHRPAWSGDGASLAYGVYNAGIWLVDIATRTISSIPGTSTVQDAVREPACSWNPNGSEFAYLKQQLWITSPDGLSNRQVKVLPD